MASGARNTETNRRLAPTIGEKNKKGGGRARKRKGKERREEKRKKKRKSAGDKYLKRYTRRGDNADYTMQRLEN